LEVWHLEKRRSAEARASRFLLQLSSWQFSLRRGTPQRNRNEMGETILGGLHHQYGRM
jgi:hypothetical protein